MADTEVEETLREIRERVLASAPVRATEGARVVTQNGGGGDAPSPQGGDAGEALARMHANLSTTGRAWSRLPPLMSNRRGALARVEVWLKRLIKRAAHWFTWEQVNFNSAAHNALGDAHAALDAHGRTMDAHGRTMDAHASALASLREELARLRAEVESGAARATELEARVSSAESRFESRLESRLAELQGAIASGLDGLRGESRARDDELGDALRDELHDRTDGLLEEQRVCFRQLSLEASELSVAHDRARRAVEARLEALEEKVKSD